MTQGKQDNKTDSRSTFHSFYDLMKYKVHRILLVSSLYDAFILEEDGLLSEQISGEYQDLELSSPPRVVRVSSGKEALQELKHSQYDLIITMTHLVDTDPYAFGRSAKELQPGTTVVMLVTDSADLAEFYRPGKHDSIDKVFFWNGDSALFVAITKYVEDMKNVEVDTDTGFVRTILVVEDSPIYYSRFLPIIYTEVMTQTKTLIAGGLNEHEKYFRKKARPKILLAETYEQGVELYRKHRKTILGVISDVKYHKDDRKDPEAGFKFVEEIEKGIPILIQSSNSEHEIRAKELGIPFMNKHSDTMPQELRDYFKEYLGFGDFFFVTPEGEELGSARDLLDFIEIAEKVPAESIKHHASMNHFSNWLMARGEIEVARKIRPKRLSDFKDTEELRRFLIDSIKASTIAKRRGVITEFAQQNFEYEETFTKLGGGSLGGKGRGLAFLSSLLIQSNMESRIHNCRIRVPDTLVIGTDLFDKFMEENNLFEIQNSELDDSEIKSRFVNSKMPVEVRDALKTYLSHVKEPLAVRSSSLLEDSQNQPFAGIYSTYMLPNNCEDDETRLDQLCQAVKLVYASAFFKAAKAYIHTTVHAADDEKMAVVIQKLVGNKFGTRFYPVYSGVAQSYNFYPTAPLKREDGIISAALGLGKIVVEGEKVISFSPNRPNIVPGFSTPEEIQNNSQRHFYALNMAETCYELTAGEEATLLTLKISEAETDNTLDLLASTLDTNDNRLRDGVRGTGPKMITFAGILKYEMLPMVEIIKELLEIGAEGMGGPVEIEFAGQTDENGKPEFFILQIRPLVTLKEKRQVKIEDEEFKEAMISSDKALGNGVITDIHDIIYVSPETFDKTRTFEMAREIGQVNSRLEGRPYILIGPGRWGTRDRFLGIPVDWDHISSAKAIVEVSLKDFRVDPSHGTHFFHNITSLGIMYFTVPYGRKDARVDWDWLEAHEIDYNTNFVKHVHLPYPLVVKVDGRTGQGIVIKDEDRGTLE